MTAVAEQFDKTMDEINSSVDDLWEQVRISKGFAVFDPAEDSSAVQVMQRADELMYEDKRDRKKHSEK